MKKICKQCNEEFTKPTNLSKEKWLGRLFCNKDCRLKAYPTQVKLICKQCSNEYKVRKSKENRSKFCSKECMNNAYPPKVDLTCEECMKEFSVRNYLGNCTKFCSHSCASKNRDEGKRTEQKIIRQSWAYKLWRTTVFERDNYTCVSCGVRGGVLNADHIQPFALFPELRLDLNNGRTLCLDCHKQTETYGNRSIYQQRCYATGSTV